ncbi:hypothetical protein [Streptomyces sp. B4I13]|uniref:hypothetical protein n=1 Tax=Streptomyces sp. B4I13 TaxID=3042271 RepID=UPI0027D879AE|nr:hypothetical protein [Streptomyces sp. B4I13]
MNKDYGQSLSIGESNYLYARGTNTSSSQKSGTLHLYYAPAGLLVYPSNWVELPLETRVLGAPVSAPPNGTFVTRSPYLWDRVPPPPPGSSHYCLVSRLATDAHPNPLPDVLQIQDFAQFIASNRGMAWRNLTQVTDPNPPQIERSVLYEQGDLEHMVYVLIRAENIPIGCEIEFHCGSEGPQPLLSLPRTTVTNASSFVAGVYSMIPAGFSSYITYNLWTNGKTLPVNAKLTLSAQYTENSGDPELVGAVDLRELVPEHLISPDHKERLQVGPVRAITLGSDRVVRVPA